MGLTSRETFVLVVCSPFGESLVAERGHEEGLENRGISASAMTAPRDRFGNPRDRDFGRRVLDRDTDSWYSNDASPLRIAAVSSPVARQREGRHWRD